MAEHIECKLEIPNVGRSITDHGWEEIDAIHIRYWKFAAIRFRKFTYDFPKNPITIEVDWTPVVRRLRRHYRILGEAKKAGGAPNHGLPSKKFPSSPVRVSLRASADRKPDDIKDAMRPKLVIESYLYDFFFIMNIAAPGSCNFYKAKLKYNKREIESTLLLSEFSFDMAFLGNQLGKWPTVKTLPLDDVNTWFRHMRDGVSQASRNPMEKIFFAILHISVSKYSPVSVVWLVYALETLFDTKADESLRVLADRISLLLSPNYNERRHLRKMLKAMYDIRNGLIHGGLEVIHPMHHEFLEGNVVSIFMRVADSIEFGFRLLLCSLQTVIERGWDVPRFEEVLKNPK